MTSNALSVLAEQTLNYMYRNVWEPRHQSKRWERGL